MAGSDQVEGSAREHILWSWHSSTAHECSLSLDSSGLMSKTHSSVVTHTKRIVECLKIISLCGEVADHSELEVWKRIAATNV
jgi:hypothetical protein